MFGPAPAEGDPSIHDPSAPARRAAKAGSADRQTDDMAPGAAAASLNAAPLAAPGTARRPTFTRSKHTDERPMPPGVTMRRYEPTNGESPYWQAALPGEQTDNVGRHTRRGTWGFFVGRSEEETITMIEEWVSTHYVPS